MRKTTSLPVHLSPHPFVVEKVGKRNRERGGGRLGGLEKMGCEEVGRRPGREPRELLEKEPSVTVSWPWPWGRRGRAAGRSVWARAEGRGRQARRPCGNSLEVFSARVLWSKLLLPLMNSFWFLC